MEINYVESKDGKKLFSFHRHDFKQYTDHEGNYMMIDGGSDYTRFTVDDVNSFFKRGGIKELIKDIREQFIWGSIYDKKGNKLKEIKYVLLKDLKSDHILNILIDVPLTNIIQNILLNDLKYRK